MTGLHDADRGQRLSRRLPGPLRRLARRYSDWNYAWQVDIALRYVPVEAALSADGWLTGKARVLDVGCGSKGGVTSYVPVRTVGVDLSFNEARIRRHPAVTPVVGSALRLPVADAAVDVALCMDTLEHLSPSQREQLIDELFRVTRPGGVVIAGAPCGLKARAAEQVASARYQGRTGREHPWLAEHLMYPPMTPDGLRSMMGDAAGRRFVRYEVRLVANTNLQLWQLLQEQGALRHVHRALFRPWWPWLREQHAPPVYRQVCIVRDTTKPWSGTDSPGRVVEPRTTHERLST
ncbi:MAG: class I SAM-dependent methyltransferase [Caldilineales bacterium]